MLWPIGLRLSMVKMATSKFDRMSAAVSGHVQIQGCHGHGQCLPPELQLNYSVWHFMSWRHCTVKLGLDVFTITFKYGLKNGSKLWVPTALLSSTESYLKKKPSCLFDESQLKDRLFISFLDVVQIRAFQSCAGDVFCSSCPFQELPASELDIFNPNPHPSNL